MKIIQEELKILEESEKAPKLSSTEIINSNLLYETKRITMEEILKYILAKIYSKENGGNEPVLYTVHSGTDYFDLVARILPDVENNTLVYKKESRFLLDALLNKKVLILDEINRTQIDTALGIFFTYLEREHRLEDVKKIKEIIEMELGINLNEDDLKEKLDFFRVIGTLNIYDKTFLFKLGDALRRRFTFINVTTDESKLEKIKNNFDIFLKAIKFEGDEEIARELFEIFCKINEIKELGLGILKDLINFSSYYEEKNIAKENSIIHIILPFFENDMKWLELEKILTYYGMDLAAKMLKKMNYDVLSQEG